MATPNGRQPAPNPPSRPCRAATKRLPEDLYQLLKAHTGSRVGSTSPYQIVVAELPTTAAFEVVRRREQLVLVFNAGHPLYRDLYGPLAMSDSDRDQDTAKRVALAVLAAARAEASATRRSHRDEVPTVPPVLGRRVGNLLQRIAMTAESIVLPIPKRWSVKSRQAFAGFAEALAANGKSPASQVDTARRDGLARPGRGLAAAIHIVDDLADQGWTIEIHDDGAVAVAPPDAETDPATEKRRVQRQELLKRDEQLASPTVRRFITEMERPREFNGKFISIFSVMRDGAELAEGLREIRQREDADNTAWQAAIDPYVQVISNGDRCCAHWAAPRRYLALLSAHLEQPLHEHAWTDDAHPRS